MVRRSAIELADELLGGPRNDDNAMITPVESRLWIEAERGVVVLVSAIGRDDCKSLRERGDIAVRLVAVTIGWKNGTIRAATALEHEAAIPCYWQAQFEFRAERHAANTNSLFDGSR